MRRRLGLSGKRFAGKDTLADLLVTKAHARGIEVVTHAFASESKRMFVEQEAANGVSIDLDRLLGDRAYKEERRPALTAFTVAALDKDPLVFCRRVADRMERDPRPSLVTDVRLRVEVVHLRERFQLHLVRIARSDASRARSGWKRIPSVDDHETETQLDDPALWDEVIPNDGSLDDLALQADALAARL